MTKTKVLFLFFDFLFPAKGQRTPMPSGKYERHGKTPKQEILKFVEFCFREDIAKQLEKETSPHLLAVKLYEEATGIKIKPKTAYAQRGKWMMINDRLTRVRA